MDLQLLPVPGRSKKKGAGNSGALLPPRTRSGSGRIIKVVLDRARRRFPAELLFPLELHIGVDLVVGEHVALGQERAVVVERDQSLAKAAAAGRHVVLFLWWL